MKRYLLFVLFISCPIFLLAQLQMEIPIGEKVHSTEDKEAISGEILLQIYAGVDINTVLHELKTVNGKNTELVALQEISDIMHIWHLKYNSLLVSDNELLAAIKSHRLVREAQFNHYVELRNTEPNDPQYAQQWQYDNDGSNGGVVDADIDAPEAWDITTGGITADGDTIVVAIIDDGVNLNHPDLQGNLWKNYSEIPGNGIDDDGNGYIDDYDGWNAANNNGTITGGSHGTPVAGIVGARGDNNVGVAGVNWDVKLMIIRGSSGTESTVVAAYNYALKMRKLYNQTNGVQGAFVVASNSSFGVDNGNPANYPLWCAMYDSMGVAGILSAGATANANFNVDVTGDIPTACSSDYLISVTNVGRNDVKVTSAGYGATTIDLGSFGESTWTLTQSSYGAFGGTSGATPHVAGTIALMYSAPCSDFIQFAKTDPAAATLQVKEWIIQSGDPNTSLSGITVSGNRLNAFNAVSEVLNNCGPCPLPGGIKALNITVNGASISWNASNNGTEYIVQYREMGTGAWLEEIVSTSPATMAGLTPCTTYEYRLRSVCNTDSSTNYSLTRTFKTDGCCEPPLSTSVSNTTISSAQISWPAVTAATAYNFRYRTTGASVWTENNNLSTANNSLANLATCTQYDYQIATVCTSGTTAYGSLYTFKTKGCGACEENTYCSATASSDYVYIEKVQLGNINNTSGDNGGYGNNIDGNYAWLKADSASAISLTPSFPLFALTANWRVWIDWNQNGVFESSELAYQGSGNSTVNGTITPPITADTGITRMRVAAVALQQPTECGDVGFGEAEDYCVRIKPSWYAGINTHNVNEASVLVYPNPANSLVNIKITHGNYNRMELMDVSGKVLRSISLEMNTEQIQLSIEEIPNGVYFIQLKGIENTLTKKIIIKK